MQGYGIVAVPADQACQGVRYFLAIEAFIGILFTSICTAIFYSKIVRLHAQAHVTFSSSICLQYGDGVTESVFDVLHNEKDSETMDCLQDDAIVNFPVIEMRCVNDRAKEGGYEIIGATLTCIVSAIEEVEQDEEDEDCYMELLRDDGSNESSHGTIKRRAFSALTVTPDTHPYFSSGIWYFRHILDHASPLLKSSVTKRIVELRGWPADLDSPGKIRGCFKETVEEIVITFKGTSNLTANTVFLNQTYLLSDIYIGWKFAGMAYLVNKGTRTKKHPGVALDLKLIHDIVPALGEEYEPLGSREANALTFAPAASSGGT